MNGCVNFILAQPFIVYSYFLPRISNRQMTYMNIKTLALLFGKRSCQLGC